VVGLREDGVVHEVDQLALAGDVGVERHPGAAEPLADRTHRQRRHAVLVGDRDRRGDDLVDRQPLLGPRALLSRVRSAPEERHRAAGVPLTGEHDHVCNSLRRKVRLLIITLQHKERRVRCGTRPTATT
jgi:hypothetical protein